MNEPSRIPAENLDMAREALELAQERHPGVVAAADQMKAYSAEKEPLMRAVASEVPGARYEMVEPTPMGLAWEYAVVAAVRQRTRLVCTHFQYGPPQLSQVAWIDLTLTTLTCEACFAAVALAIARRTGGQAPDDGRCDVCDDPTQVFGGFHVQVGMWMVSGNQCSTCTEAMMDGNS